MKALSARELATILAALRWWQRSIVTGKEMNEEMDIAEDGGAFARLSIIEINKLCEGLNCGEKSAAKNS